MCGVMPGETRWEPSKRRKRRLLYVIVQPYESFGAVGIGEDPGTKPLLDGFLLVARGQRFFLVQHALFFPISLEDVIDGWTFEVKGLLQQPDTVGACRTIVRRGGHRTRRG